MKYTLELVNEKPELWKHSDPVRPELGISYKTYPGRYVFALRDENGVYVSFCCVARCTGVPHDVMSLSNMTLSDGRVYVPYTVWSLKRGSGKKIINQLLEFVKDNELAAGVSRVVTLSPNTDMARDFHLRNGAKEIATSVVTANFEYKI